MSSSRARARSSAITLLALLLTAPAVAKPAKNTPAVEVVQLARQHTVAIRVTVAGADLGDAVAAAVPTLLKHIGKRGAQLVGPPYTRFLARDGEQWSVEIGMPVAQATKGRGDVIASELPKGRAASLAHVGPYDQLPKIHSRMRAWLARTEHTAAGPAWEVYLSNPLLEPNRAKWEAKVFVPLK